MSWCKCVKFYEVFHFIFVDPTSFCTRIYCCQYCRPVVEELEKKNKKVKSVKDMEGFHECAEKVIIEHNWVKLMIRT